MGFLTKVLRLQEEEDSLNFPHTKLNQELGGLCRSKFFVIAGESKTGKSKFACETFILGVYLKNPNKKFKVYFYSLEVGLLEIMANWSSYFISHKFNYILDAKNILGRAKDEKGDKILLTAQELGYLKSVNHYLVDLLGEYDDNMICVKEGMVKLITDTSNPTGIYNDMTKEALKYGKIHKIPYQTLDDYGKTITREKFDRYEVIDDTQVLIIIDDLRLVGRERGYSEKENIDKTTEYINSLRLKFGFTFIVTQHMNRAITDVQRLKYLGERVYPTASDLKSSGDPGERCTQLITIFNPFDPQYGLTKHFGVENKNYAPNTYRSVHLVLNRDGDCPCHYRHEFNGKAGSFKEL